MLLLLCCAAALSVLADAQDAQAQQQAFGKQWGSSYSTQDWNRLYHYPYVYYPQNFWSSEYYQSSNDLYFRYPPEMRVPVYNKQWMNFYPEGALYHTGHHFILDTF
ncbi:MAG: calmodulin-binding protein [Pirellulales bacterium]